MPNEALPILGFGCTRCRIIRLHCASPINSGNLPALTSPYPASYREIRHKEAADTIPPLGLGQDAAMPIRDHNGKTVQDYRPAPIVELDAPPRYRRRRKAQHSTLRFVWLLVPAALFWINWLGVQHWHHPAHVAEPPIASSEIQLPTLPPALANPAPCQALAAPQLLDSHPSQSNVMDEGVPRRDYYDVPRTQKPDSAAPDNGVEGPSCTLPNAARASPIVYFTFDRSTGWVRNRSSRISYLTVWNWQNICINLIRKTSKKQLNPNIKTISMTKFKRKKPCLPI